MRVVSKYHLDGQKTCPDCGVEYHDSFDDCPRCKPEISTYEQETYKWRCHSESLRTDGYCGSCPIKVHAEQMRDPNSWVQLVVKTWERDWNRKTMPNRLEAAESRIKELEAEAERSHRVNKKIISELKKRPTRSYHGLIKTKLEVAESRIKELEAKLDARQATIDALMLEFCPDEMTSEQRKEWEKNQVPAKQSYVHSDGTG